MCTNLVEKLLYTTTGKDVFAIFEWCGSFGLGCSAWSRAEGPHVGFVSLNPLSLHPHPDLCSRDPVQLQGLEPEFDIMSCPRYASGAPNPLLGSMCEQGEC